MIDSVEEFNKKCKVEFFKENRVLDSSLGA